MTDFFQIVSFPVTRMNHNNSIEKYLEDTINEYLRGQQELTEYDIDYTGLLFLLKLIKTSKTVFFKCTAKSI